MPKTAQVLHIIQAALLRREAGEGRFSREWPPVNLVAKVADQGGYAGRQRRVLPLVTSIFQRPAIRVSVSRSVS